MAVAPGQVHHHSFKMMGDGLSRPQSALMRGVQITEFKDSRVNPQPIVLEESDILLEEYLSPTKLRLLTGVDNLESVQSLEMRVDTSDTSLGNFGAMLPNLSQLKLSNSVVRSIRDVGSSLRGLQVLWMSRCELQELDGLSSMSRLSELYLSYNEIADLSPLSMLENLEILDLEGNNIEDISQIQYLELCSRLRHLTLEANPICVMSSPDSQQLNYDYRGTIRKMLPQLQYLDDEPIVSSDCSKKSNVFDEDWAYLDELQKDLGLQTLNTVEDEEDTALSVRPGSATRVLAGYRPGSALRPSTGMRPLTRQGSPRSRTKGSPSSGGRPGSSGRPGTANRPPSGEENEVAESASVLTKGSVICGNPVRALRNRRANSFTPPGKETAPKLFAQHCENVEHDPVPGELSDPAELLTELREWREHHSKLVEQISEERAPQVLTVVPGEGSELSGSESESDDDESGAVRAASTACHKPPSRQAISVQPPPTSPTQHGRPRTPEFRARRFHLPGSQSPVGDSTGSSVWTRRHDESFDDEEATSPDIIRQGRRTSSSHTPSVGMSLESPVPAIITGKPTVPAIPRQSPLHRHSRNEALRPGLISEVTPKLPNGAPKPPNGAPRPSSGAALPPRVPSLRASPVLSSQLRIKRQLPTPPSQRPGPPN